MGRSGAFRRLARSIEKAAFCEREGLPTAEGIERFDELRRVGRRSFLASSATAAAGAALAGCALDVGRSPSALPAASGDVGIVGAGLAGLACARELGRYGIAATVHEGGDRVGGRVASLAGVFPGQIVERGGELIDTTHTTMRGWANELGLTLENYHREEGGVTYFFDGAHVPESAIVDEWRAFVPAMQDDLRTLGAPTADAWTEADRVLDRMTLAEYLESRGAGHYLHEALGVAYEIEYGRATSEQSALNLLLFAHADRRSRFQPFGVFSDEKYHVVEGNQAIPEGLAAELAEPVRFGRVLVRAAKRSDGRVELTFQEGRRTTTAVHDAVVFAIPFSTLRLVELDPSLGLPAWKTTAIQEAGYGTNAKLMVGFTAQPWLAHGSNGSSYSDLPNLQCTWQTNGINATSTQAVLTDYTGGALGASLDPSRTQREAGRFLADLDRVWPGAAAAAARDRRGNVVAHLEHWPSNPLSRGSYTCNKPGYFTTVAGNEGKPVGNVFFAGEHTDSFYEWQGFMEGAANSGLRAAGEVGDLLRTRGSWAARTSPRGRRGFFTV